MGADPNVEYQGRHTPIIDENTWQMVQSVLSSHINGERNREHPHFLKSSLFCRNCGSRMIITYASSRSGVKYPYFVCAGRHSKRKNCTQKAILIEEVERSLELKYEEHNIDPEIRLLLETAISEDISKLQKQFEADIYRLKREKEKLERKRKKLLEAHYNDAIPLDLMKSEQAEINKALVGINNQLNAHDTEFNTLVKHLQKAFDLVEDCGRTYKYAEDHIKRIINQALCERIWIEPDGNVTADFAEPFKTIVAPVWGDIARYNTAKHSGHFDLNAKITAYIETIQNHVSIFFRYGLNKEFLVELQGLEPWTSSMP